MVAMVDNTVNVLNDTIVHFKMVKIVNFISCITLKF